MSQYRNIITRSIGVDAEVEVDLYYVALEQQTSALQRWPQRDGYG